MPPVFKWLFGLGTVPDADMWRTFNCGIGMVLIVKPQDVKKVLELLSAGDEHATVIGVVEKRVDDNDQVIFA